MPHRLLDRRDDVGVRPAAAEIAAHQFANFVGARRLALGDQTRGRTDLPRRTVAALECVMVDERLLQRMQCAVHSQTLGRGHIGTVLHHGQGQAGIDPPPTTNTYTHRIGRDRTPSSYRSGRDGRAAHRAGRPRREFELSVDAVDDQRHWDLLRHRNILA